VREDTLRSPAFTDSSTGGLATFDCVIANPPFSLKEWGREVWEADPWGRTAYGLPPARYGDFAFVEHMVASMAEGRGRMAVVLPQGALMRRGAEGTIRRALLQSDLVESVIGLAPNLFFGTPLAACVVVLRRSKPAERRGRVLFVDAENLVREGRAQNFLDPEHVSRIVGWVESFSDVEGYASIATIDDIARQGWALSVSRYVRLGDDGAHLSLIEASSDLRRAVAESRRAEDRLRTVLIEGGWLR